MLSQQETQTRRESSIWMVLITSLRLLFYLFSRSQSPSVPLISWLGVHFSVRLSPAWWRDKYPRNTSMSFFYHRRGKKRRQVETFMFAYHTDSFRFRDPHQM